MLHRPSLSRSAEAPLAGGDGATLPPVASSAAARPPRAAATLYDEAFPAGNGPLERQAAEDWFYDQLDVIDSSAFETLDALGDEGLIRRWVAHTTAEERAEQTEAVLERWRALASPAPSTTASASVVSATTPSRERRLKDERPLFTPALAPEDWARDPFADLDAPVGPMRLAVVALMCAMLGVLGMFALTLAYVGGLL